MKKNIGILLIISSTFFACSKKEESNKSYLQQVNWEDKKSDIDNFDNYVHGEIYLPVYSHIYHIHEYKTIGLAITISIRNVSTKDTVYLQKADYYNTAGSNIRQYIKSPIYIKPLETLEIVIAEQDSEGGSGANFLFDWAMVNGKNPPLAEAIMISTYGQQGLSFSTRGIQITE